ncbi:[protein-PII] uridylyltransferase [Leekyejoonella antrihumi]|uniref:[protein-PII] uridylyltransferase n=1 Tax=Leekyejoonella antrihumi TaxID=1660198 RepID=UPI001FEACA7C|nr:[protein-PII] uridylyltransferase [Leekyejoonella antrihumi]
MKLAGTREFQAQSGGTSTDAPAGPGRRGRLTAYARETLCDIWQEACGTHHRDGVALAAVGSLARGDLGPLSDFDLVLLHDGRTLGNDDVEALAARVWYPLWDAGFRLDHSVRTRAQCRKVAADDLTAAVGLLDITTVAGDPELVAGVQGSIAHDWRANARRRLPELFDGVRARHERYGDVATSIDPDLKEGRGGLRDMTVLRALATAWLTDRPHGDVDLAHAALLDVRDALHVVTGRGRDRLVREEQDAVAALLGHPDSDALMTAVTQAARSVSFALDATTRRATQSQRARTLRSGPRRPRLTPLGYGCYEHDGEVVLGPGADAGDPLLILRAARLAAARSLPLAPATVARLAVAARPPTDPWPPELRDAFMDLLAAGPGLVTVWEALDMGRFIDLLIPEWSAVRGRPQRGGVHVHTVDRHLIETVVRAGELRAQVRRPDLLLLAALLHDIGKVAGSRDHSAEGAPVAAAIARRSGLQSDEAELVRLLVREHLALADLATRRDVAEPATVTALLDVVGHQRDVLDLLAGLTRADALAAGPKAWTPWRASLIVELADRARASLGSAEVAAPEPSDVPEPHGHLDGEVPRVTIHRDPAGARIEITDHDRSGLFADTAGLLSAHGLVVRSARVRTLGGLALDTWHVEATTGDLPEAAGLVRSLRRMEAGDRTPLRSLAGRRPCRAAGLVTRATVIPGAGAEVTAIEVRAQDHPGLLYDVGRVFAGFALAVRSAHVATYAGQSLDTFYLTPDGRGPLTPPDVARLIGAVIDACDGVDEADSTGR